MLRYQWLKAFETIHSHYVYGLMDRQLLGRLGGTARHYVVAPELRTIGNFGLKLSPNAFAISLIHSNHPTDQRTVGTLFKEERS